MEDGCPEVILHLEGIPELRITENSKTKGRLGSRLRDEAAWLLSGVQRRHTILLRVVRAAAELQKKFMEGRRPDPGPCTIRAVADCAGLHPSTVSRVASRTWVSTPRGRVSLATLVGKDRASRIRDAISDLLRSPESAGLSDQAVAEDLRARGLPISRRTVARYRARLGVGDSFTRRKRQEGDMRHREENHEPSTNPTPGWPERALTHLILA